MKLFEIAFKGAAPIDVRRKWKSRGCGEIEFSLILGANMIVAEALCNYSGYDIKYPITI